MSKIRAILFDLDETLIDRHETMRLFLVQQHPRFDELSHCDADIFAAICLKFQKNGYADKLDAFTQACRSLKVTDPDLPDALFADFKTHYGTKAVAFEGTLEVIETLHKHFALGLVTNGRTVGQMAKLKCTGLAPFFSATVISERHGVKKPDYSIFKACLDELGISAQEAIFIGDNPSADIAPAHALGMSTVWMRSAHFNEPDHCDAIADDVRELPALIDKMSDVNAN